MVQTYGTGIPKGGICMKGYVSYHRDRGYFSVGWYNPTTGRDERIYRYLDGSRMHTRKEAEKLLAIMQGDAERGPFQIERYKHGYGDIESFLWEWLEEIGENIKPGTYKDYRNSIRNHLVPFFERNPMALHEIQLDVLNRLKRSIPRSGKGKQNVMYCLHACLDYAWRAGKITAVPPFPKKKDYKIQKRVIRWLSEDRQMKVINAIPEVHRPIFLWLKYHFRRPGEAMALHLEDWDGESFIVHRTFSDKQLTETTKTGEVHVIPCVDEFKKTLIRYLTRRKKNGILLLSKYLFVNPFGRKPGKHYTSVTMNNLWHQACRDVGESIDMYSGLKHSSCSQFINERGGTLSELQEVTDHARWESVRQYAKTELARKKQLMERKVIRI